MTLIEETVSDEIMKKAYEWLCRRRKNYGHNNDVWHLRFYWTVIKKQIQEALVNGRYRLEPLQRIHREGQEPIDLWSSRDALVLKAISLVLKSHLKPYLSSTCYHLSGGCKAAVRKVANQIDKHSFVMKTDVYHYYYSIDHQILMTKLKKVVFCSITLSLISQYLHRIVDDGGWYKEINNGISLGCPLSPLMGDFFLSELDKQMERMGYCYVRFMDDILILTSTRGRLRKAVRRVHSFMESVRLSLHPCKTFIGRVSKGFDFLGYHFSGKGNVLTLAQKTIDYFLTKVRRLSEQDTRDITRIDDYVRRWLIWATSGVSVFDVSSFILLVRSALRGAHLPSECTAGAEVANLVSRSRAVWGCRW